MPSVVLTIGAYYNKVPGSIGVGIDRGPATDRIMDMRDLQYPDDSVDAIYTFDAVEHVPLRDQPVVFREFHRVLRPGGTIEVCTIDLEGLCREFLAGDAAKRSVLLQHFYGGQLFPGDFHCAAYDEAMLRERMAMAGFTCIERVTPSHPWGGALSLCGEKP
jgi:predicted SAM-dependent methyltransferase